MSLILKGIDMPRNGDCHHITIYDNGNTYITTSNVLYETDRKDAEAIQIPKGHGGIKDEKEIIKRLEEKEKEPLYQHDTDDWWVGIIDAETEVNNAPTILEAEK